MSARSTTQTPVRWWNSARVRITAGITLITAMVFAAMVAFTAQLLALSAERVIDSRLNRETADFSTFMTAGILPSFESEDPTVEQLLRAYLAQQYPSAELLLVGTAAESGTQFTLSRFGATEDELFPPGVRSRLQRIGLASADDSGRIDPSVQWRKTTVESPAGPASLVVAVNDIGTSGETRRVVESLLWASLGGMIFSAFLAWWIAGHMLEPVRRIRETAETISAEDLSKRVPSDGPDEIVALADTVNEMLERVEDAYRTQREFLDDAGHELRTPLTVLQGNLDLMLDDPEGRAASVRVMQDELSRMTRIVEDLLTLARADRPDFLLTSPVEVSELILDIEAKVDVIADRDWTVLPYAEGFAVLDRQRITQALMQFCSNAVRFTAPGDRIEIGCRTLEPGEPTIPADAAEGPTPGGDAKELGRRRLLWWVRDRGAGIPAGEEASIFERFHTARGQLRDGRGGTGLGLAIVSTIARAHGGRAFAFNAKGGGASFCIVIPFVDADDEMPTGSPSPEDDRVPTDGEAR